MLILPIPSSTMLSSLSSSSSSSSNSSPTLVSQKGICLDTALLLQLLLILCSCCSPCVSLALSSSQVEPFPTSPASVTKQASAAITRAYQDGINKQTVRLPLSDTMYSDKEEGFVATRAIGWQGGPQETIRFLAPISSSVLQGIWTAGEENTAGLVARVSEQTLLDYDGSVLQTAEHPAGALYDIQALLQANTDNYYLDTVQKIEEQFSDTPGKAKRLFLLVNPAWRDKSSWGFFGGQRAQELILDQYDTTYAVDEFIVAGERVGLLKCWPNDWAVYIATNPDDAANMEVMSSLIATFEKRPEYKQIEKALKEYRSKNS